MSGVNKSLHTIGINMPSLLYFASLEFQKVVITIFSRGQGYPERDADPAEHIRQQQKKSFQAYGYGKIFPTLRQEGIARNPKTVLRIMQKYNLLQ